MINIEVERNPNENSLNVLRRFTKRVQGAGVLPKVRGGRYQTRTPSSYTRKKMALKRLRRITEVLKQIKLGKLPDKLRK